MAERRIEKKKMRKKVSFEIEVPDSVTYEELLAWLRFELGEIRELKRAKALADVELEAVSGTVEVRSA